ncbi:hypothetical protein Cgig2_011829 [Carnegiea gigantea]|uniref:Nicotianamine synthase n=1 Tax=Carnegiea gigantea TaxID=171969 RepID=A0A9Q1GU02_9CARY|nr:hypothetical protein Cgig2_011829 [Carnegiea gigantea]
MGCQEEQVLKQVIELYEKILSLGSLKPSKDLNKLFTQLVLVCLAPSEIDVTKLAPKFQEMRSKLLGLRAEAEGHLETHYSTIIGNCYDEPLNYLHICPYFDRYIKRCFLEYNILTKYSTQVPRRVAMIGSGPLPLTSIILALRHLPATQFDNYDLDPAANEMAARLVESDSNLSSRMHFHTKNVMSIGKDELQEYDVVFLAALVGLERQEKIQVIQHLAQNMAPGSDLLFIFDL